MSRSRHVDLANRHLAAARRRLAAGRLSAATTSLGQAARHGALAPLADQAKLQRAVGDVLRLVGVALRAALCPGLPPDGPGVEEIQGSSTIRRRD